MMCSLISVSFLFNQFQVCQRQGKHYCNQSKKKFIHFFFFRHKFVILDPIMHIARSRWPWIWLMPLREWLTDFIYFTENGLLNLHRFYFPTQNLNCFRILEVLSITRLESIHCRWNAGNWFLFTFLVPNSFSSFLSVDWCAKWWQWMWICGLAYIRVAYTAEC